MFWKTWCKLIKKTSTFKWQILTKFITFTNGLIAIRKTQFILQNVINVGINTLAVPIPSFVIELTYMKVLTVDLITKSKLSKKL